MKESDLSDHQLAEFQLADHQLANNRVRALFVLDDQERLVEVNTPFRQTAPQFWLSRTREGSIAHVRHDVPDDLAALLFDLALKEPPWAGDPLPAFNDEYLRLLPDHEKIWSGPAFRFQADLPDMDPQARITEITDANKELLQPYMQDWEIDIPYAGPMMAALDDDAGGKAVAIAATVRTSDGANELGLETHKDFRRRGHARNATIAWAKAMRAQGRIPVYSTDYDNTASRANVTSLGLHQISSDFSIT